MAEIDKILEQQERALLKLEESEVRAFLQVYNDARRELRERLNEAVDRLGEDSWTAQHTRIALAETEAGVSALKERLDVILGRQVQRRFDFSLRNLTQVIALHEPDFLGTSAGINTRALQRLTRDGDLLLHRYSTSRYSAELMDRIQAELARGHAARLPRTEVVRRIAGLDDSVFAGMEHRAALIDRMENARAYDSAFRAGLDEAAAELDLPDDPDPFLKKAIEFIDKRSHPFSAAVDGRVAPRDGEWEVPVSEVQAEGKKMGKSISGVVWPSDGSFYRGATYPAHFNDRGRGIPWRASWGPFKGPIPGQTPAAKAPPPPPPPKPTPPPPKPPRAKPAPPPRPPARPAPTGPTTPFDLKAPDTSSFWKPTSPGSGKAGEGTVFDTSKPTPIPSGVLQRTARVPNNIYDAIKEGAALIPERVLLALEDRQGFELWAANHYADTSMFPGARRRSLSRYMSTTRGISDLTSALVNTAPKMRQGRNLGTFTQAALHESAHALDGAWVKRTRKGVSLNRAEAASIFSRSKEWRAFHRKARADGTAAKFALECEKAHEMVGSAAYFSGDPAEFFAEVVRMAWSGQKGRDYLEATWPGILDSLDEMFTSRLSL